MFTYYMSDAKTIIHNLLNYLTAWLISRGQNELLSIINHAKCLTLTYDTNPDGASLYWQANVVDDGPNVAADGESCSIEIDK